VPARRARASPPSAAGWPWWSPKGGFRHRQIAVDEEDFTETLPEPCRAPAAAGPPAGLGQPWGVSRRSGGWTRAQLEASLAGWLDKTRPGELTGEVFRAELKAGRCLLILDGVDEVPESRGDDLPRRNLLTGLADALPAWRKAGNWLLLTSRPYGLEAEDQRRLGLPVAELAELPGRSCSSSCAAGSMPSIRQRRGQGRWLLQHLDQRDDLAEMRSNRCCSPPCA
jgi:hypothetical protein